jgi:hypothetical protein
LVISRLQKKSLLESNLDSKSNLIKKWMNRVISLADFQNTNDLKLATGMRLGSSALQKPDISLEKVSELINNKISRLSRLIT